MNVWSRFGPRLTAGAPSSGDAPATRPRRPVPLRSAALLLVVLAASCARLAPLPRWSAPDRPDEIDVRRLLESEDPTAIFRHMKPGEIPRIPVPTHLRPCCAFGSRIGVRLGPLPVPGYRIPNILGPDELGHHYYDNGILTPSATPDEEGELTGERNGLVYTCRAGFVDTAHVREWVDWSTFLGTRIARNLERGVTLDLPPEGGTRTLRLAGCDPGLIDRLGRRRVTIPLAQWLAFQLSVWHEIVTWFGWSHFEAFPERASAFSPEDLYSNAIGTRIMGALAAQRTGRDELLYNASVDQWMRRVLVELGAVSRELGVEAAEAVDGLWWDSDEQLPAAALVRKRNLGIESPIRPWRVPQERMPSRLRAACAGAPRAPAIHVPDADGGVAFGDRATIEIELGDELAAREPFASIGPRITQADFPRIVAFIREDVRRRFGPEATEPD